MTRSAIAAAVEEIAGWAEEAATLAPVTPGPTGGDIRSRMLRWNAARLGRPVQPVTAARPEAYLRARLHQAPCISVVISLLPELDPTGASWPRLAEVIRGEHHVRDGRIIPLQLLDRAAVVVAEVPTEAHQLVIALERITDPRHQEQRVPWTVVQRLASVGSDDRVLRVAALAACLRAWRLRPDLIRVPDALIDRVAPHRVELRDLLERIDRGHQGGILRRDPAVPRTAQRSRGLPDYPADQHECAEEHAAPSKVPAAGSGRRRLVARAPDPPLPFDGDETPLEIPEWSGIGMDRLSWSTLGRSVLVLGGSGAGKTESGIRPLLDALLRAPDHPSLPRPTVVVVDPKGDLRGPASNGCRQAGRPLIQLDPGGDWILDLLERDRGVLTGARLVELMERVGSSRYRTATHQGNSAFFEATSRSLLAALIEVDLSLLNRGGMRMVEQAWRHVSVKEPGRDRRQPDRSDTGGTPEFDESVLYDRERWLQRLIGVMGRERILTRVADLADDRRLDSGIAPVLRRSADLPPETLSCVAAEGARLLTPFTTPEVAKHLPINPLEGPADALDVRSLLSSDACIVYSPRDASAAADVLGRAVKELSYRLERRTRPLVILMDEGHRYLDPESESGWLDRSRAYRSCAVVATQSIASIRTAYGSGNENAVQVLLANTGSKLFFRSVDRASQEELESLVPNPPTPGAPHVLRVRPLSLLAPGEAYVVRADGGWTRGRVNLPCEDPPPISDPAS